MKDQTPRPKQDPAYLEGVEKSTQIRRQLSELEKRRQSLQDLEQKLIKQSAAALLENPSLPFSEEDGRAKEMLELDHRKAACLEAMAACKEALKVQDDRNQDLLNAAMKRLCEEFDADYTGQVKKLYKAITDTFEALQGISAHQKRRAAAGVPAEGASSRVAALLQLPNNPGFFKLPPVQRVGHFAKQYFAHQKSVTQALSADIDRHLKKFASSASESEEQPPVPDGRPTVTEAKDRIKAATLQTGAK